MSNAYIHRFQQDSLDGIAKVTYESKDGNTFKKFDALDWLTQLTTLISNKGDQPVESLKVERMVRYYGILPLKKSSPGQTSE